MKKLLVLTIAAILSTPAQALDVFKRGRDKTTTVNCDNPTTRTDGSPIGTISKVEIYVDPQEGNVTNPLHTIIMTGGCMPSTLDLQAFPANIVYWQYGKTFTSDGLESVVSPTVDNNQFVIENPDPNAPGRIRNQ